MGETLRNSGDEGTRGRAGREGQSRPSVENLLTAFREASRRRYGSPSRQKTDEPGTSRRPQPEESESEEETPPPERGPERGPRPGPRPGSEPVSEPELRSSRSPVETIEATMAAFRKAERREAESRPRKSSAEERAQTEEPRRSERRGVTKRPEQEPTTETESRPEEEPGSAEDLAPAFRRALSERAQSEPDAAEEVPEEGGHGGEGPPPSPAGSSRPEASYLWVTDRPPGEQQGADVVGERSATVSVERLSGPRAAEAEAFLLRGGGERPYRLLRRIRGHPDASVYLKPVFWRHEEGDQSPVSMHVDGGWTGGEGVGALRETAAEINRRIEAVVEAGEIEEGGAEQRVLRFVATRNQEFVPRRPEGRGGRFVYPKLTPLLQVESQSSGGELAQILSTAARRIRRR